MSKNNKFSLYKITTFFTKNKTSFKNHVEGFVKDKKFVATPLKPDVVKAYDYFTLARSWADDFYITIEASRNRWKALSLYILTPFLMILLVSFCFLIPSQHLVPLMINHYPDGQTVVTQANKIYEPKDTAQVESDIARYIRFRESYSADTYNYSYRLIHLLSAKSVANDFSKLQSISNKQSPINLLGDKGYQTVKIQNILFLDNESKNNINKNDSTHRNLAQIDFIVTTHNKQSGKETVIPLTALISWQYKGIPESPSDRWMDWNGFVVNSYHVQIRNV